MISLNCYNFLLIMATESDAIARMIKVMQIIGVQSERRGLFEKAEVPELAGYPDLRNRCN
jgi:hypothetical protein